MPKIKLNSVTHVENGGIFGEVNCSDIAFLADQHCNNADIYRMATIRAICKIAGQDVAEYQSGNGEPFSINYDNPDKIILNKMTRDQASDGGCLSEPVRELTTEESHFFMALINLWKESVSGN